MLNQVLGNSGINAGWNLLDTKKEPLPSYDIIPDNLLNTLANNLPNTP